MTSVGTGKYRYELIETWARLPVGQTFVGQTFGNVSAVATDSEDRVYVFQRKDIYLALGTRERVDKYVLQR